MSSQNEIREKILKELKVWDQPSIAIGVVKDGEVVLADGFGMANLEQGRPAGADTLYQIGSCSKAFTAAAAALLVDQGKLAWDRPVHDYMPWVKFSDPYVTTHATVRDLLCHRTGLPRHDAYWINGPISRREMAENLRNMQPGWSFRSHWCYQNTCYVTIGVLIEEVSGMSWEKFVEENLLKPIGMDRTTFYVDHIAGDPDHADPYDRPLPTDLQGIRAISFLKSDREDAEKGIGAPYGPAGSIMSTVNDMCKWIQFNLNNGKVGDKQIISEANMKELHKANMLMEEPLLMPCPEMDFHSYGMGWFVETYRGHVLVEHGGNIDGFSSLVGMVPDQKFGMVCLTNFNNSFYTYSALYEAIDHYLGVEGGNWNQRMREFVAEAFKSQPEGLKALNGPRIEGTQPSRALEDYVGTYRNACYGDIVITLEDGKLRFLYNKQKSPVSHYHYDTFLIEDPYAIFDGMTFQFVTGRNGLLEGIRFGIALNPVVQDERFAKVEA